MKETEFEKQQLEQLISDLKDIDKYTSFKNGSFIYDLGKYQGSLLVNEIERLNNIINEYENMKKELLDYIYHNEYCRFGHIDGGEADEMRNILNRTDKLKELKESGNNV